MAKINKDELEELRDLMLTEPGIHQLITNKENALENLDPYKNVEFQVLEYAPSPLVGQWAGSVNDLQKQQIFERRQEREKAQSHFDKRIENRAKENVAIFGTAYQSQQLDQLDKQEIVILAEKGADDVLKMQRDQYKDKEIETNKEELSDIEYDRQIEEDMRLSLEQTDVIMGSRASLVDRFEDNSKDMDVSDEYE